MNHQVECPSCRAKISVKPEYVGKTGKCARCKTAFKIPELPSTDDASGDLVPIEAEAEPVAKSEALKPAPSSPPDWENGDLYTLADSPAAKKAKAAKVRKTAEPGVGVTAKGVVEAASATVKKRTPHEILSAFEGEIEPVRATLMYRVWLMVVALMMLLLPLIYLSLIGLVCYGIYYHAVNDIHVFEQMGKSRRGSQGAFLLYIGPMIVGIVAVVFLCKPLFARRRPTHAKPRVLDPQVEPLLFAFVDGICSSVGAPRPSRIEVNCMVNASAHLDGGAFAVFKNDLVLTIGLPLVAGLSLKQFAGVLAHEFGHFSQKAGMRVHLMISLINHWFARVVYERDEWDYQLEQLSKNGQAQLMLLGGICRLVVWLTRRCLWVLMYFGRLISGVLSRQMEFDADRYEARMVGADVFAATSWRLAVLNLAEQGAYGDLNASWQQRRMPDNLPKLIAANVPQLSKEMLEFLKKHVRETKTSWFDTHPCPRDRVAMAKQEAPDGGLFSLSGPASDVFEYFDSLSKITTFEQYKLMLGPEFRKDQLFTVAELIENQAVAQVGQAAADRFFMGALSLLQPLPLAWDYPKIAKEPTLAKSALVEARGKMEAGRLEYIEVMKRLDELETKAEKAQTAVLLLKAGNKIKAEVYGLDKATSASANRTRDEALAEARSLATTTAPYTEAAAKRITQSLAILESDTVANAIEDGIVHRDEARVLYQCAAHLGSNVAPEVSRLNRSFRVLNGLLQVYHAGKNQSNQSLVDAILRAGAELRDVLEEFRWKLGDTLFYPFDHAVENITLAKYALPATTPPKDDIGGLINASEEAINRTLGLYARALGRIAFIAEQVERRLGLEPLVIEPSEDSDPL